MRNNNLISKIALSIVCLSLAQCASTRAPSGWLTDPENVPLDPYGGWVTVESQLGLISGELIAVTEDTMFVADTCLHAIPLLNIQSVRLAVYNPGYWMFPAVILGTVSTISNGFYLVFTAPIWLIGGTIAAVSRSRDPIMDYPDEPLRQFTRYARYPQGLPPGLDRNEIRMKPMQ